MAEKSVISKIRELEAQKAKLVDEAKAEALATVNGGIADLQELGFEYHLVEGAMRRATPSGERKGTRTVKDEPCPICGWKTNPPHDRRSHRTQEPKRPFTAAELAAKGLTKVA